MVFEAVVLAGERPDGGKFARELNLPASVLVDVAGKSALQRVIEALGACNYARGGLVCGLPPGALEADAGLSRALGATGFRLLPAEAGPSASARTAVEWLGRYPVLLTSGDHALLTPDIVDRFCRQAQQVGADLVLGLVPYAAVKAAFPESRRTVQRYRNGSYCGANLYAVLSRAGLDALVFWQSVEALRKKPWRIAKALGFRALVQYLLRRATLEQAMARLSAVCGCRVQAVIVADARAAVDVDSAADRDLAERILRTEAEVPVAAPPLREAE